MDTISLLLFVAVLINQAGRVMVPSVMTSIMADPEFDLTVDARKEMLAGVSIVCLVGKIIGGAVTDRLGGWALLFFVFATYIISTGLICTTTDVQIFGAMWWLNSLSYTLTWGAATQIMAVTYDAAERPGKISLVASASRFGASGGSMFFGTLLSNGMHWRQALMPAIVVQALLALLCGYMTFGASKPKAEEPAAAKGAEPAKGPSAWGHLLTLNFWLMCTAKVVTFTYTQFFMNFVGQFLHMNYGYEHGAATSISGFASFGSVIGLLVVGDRIYKKMSPSGKVGLIALLMAVCTAAPALLALGKSLPFDISPLVVPLLFLWGVAYALPFYVPPGEFAMAVGGKAATALFTNLFDAFGFTMCFFWNRWATAQSKDGDFTQVLWSASLFGAIAFVCMPICMMRLNAIADKEKKAA